MYVNERDQINYHGFLRALREMNHASQERVSKGVCTVSGMNRFENGNRVAEKLMRDRLTARLGISGEKYEDYLQPKEYVRWEQRLRIVKAIEKREFVVAKEELDSYALLPGLNGVNKQFIETMHFMIASLEGAPQDVLLESISKAVKFTVSNVNKALEGSHLLSDQEINLIAEQMRLTAPKKVVRDEDVWRISEYEKLISYIDNSYWEKLQKAKVYPKIVVYICEVLLAKELTEESCKYALELCHNAIELLRDTSRLYYFIELTEMRRHFAEYLLTSKVDAVEKESLEEMLSENNEWENVFKELYAEYKVAPYMSDFCYLYYETECHNMVDVIETRRNMLGLSRVRLSEGICTDVTIIRFEREGTNPSIEIVRRLFEKMGMCAEYRRARVITNDVEALMLSEEVAKNINNRDLEAWESNLKILENKLCMNIPHNKQEISKWRNLLLLFQHKISNEEFCCGCEQILEYSISGKCIGKKEKDFLTREEWSCLFTIAFQTSVELAHVGKSLIESFCMEEKCIVDSTNIFKLELFGGGLESYLGDIGRYEESIQLSKRMITAFLNNRRMDTLSNNLYSILWNSRQFNCREIEQDFIKKSLEKCIMLSALVHKNNWAEFYAQKIQESELCH